MYRTSGPTVSAGWKALSGGTADLLLSLAPTKPITERKTEAGMVEKTLHAAGADKLIGCIGKVVIPPGGQLYIYSEYGLQGDIKVRTPGCDNSAAEKFEY